MKFKPFSEPGGFTKNLCPLCQPYNYCRGITPPLHQTKRYQLQDYLDMVPLHVLNAGMVRCSPKGKQHLQQAYDAFHQQDYEMAMLQFHDVLEDSATVEEALAGLAISYFFMADYENASRYMMYYGEAKPFKPATDIVNSFQDLCIQGAAMSAAAQHAAKDEKLLFKNGAMHEELIFGN